MDRYAKFVLTVIAAALVYLCVILTPLPALHAQQAQTTQRPGEFTGPGQVVIVGWKVPPSEAVPVTIARPVQVTGRITADPSERATRVVVSGWEELGTLERAGNAVRALGPNAGVPVAVVQR